MALLFPLYMLAFLFGQKLIVQYALRGDRGALFLRSRAEESGDYEQVKKLRFLFIALQLGSAVLITFFFVYGGFVSMADGGKNGVGMDEARQYGPYILLAVFCVSLLAATAMRLRIRRMMREAKARGEDPLPAGKAFRVSYTVDPKRIDRLMYGVMLIIYLLFFPIFLIALPDLSSVAGIVIGVILLGILAILIGEVVKEHRRVEDLLVLNEEGLWNHKPSGSVSFFPWREVKDVEVSDEDLILTLARMDPSCPGRHATASIKLDRTPISGDTIRKKIEQYRLLARQAEQKEALLALQREQQESLPDPEN